MRSFLIIGTMFKNGVRKYTTYPCVLRTSGREKGWITLSRTHSTPQTNQRRLTWRKLLFFYTSLIRECNKLSPLNRTTVVSFLPSFTPWRWLKSSLSTWWPTFLLHSRSTPVVLCLVCYSLEQNCFSEMSHVSVSCFYHLNDTWCSWCVLRMCQRVSG